MNPSGQTRIIAIDWEDKFALFLGYFLGGCEMQAGKMLSRRRRRADPNDESWIACIGLRHDLFLRVAIFESSTEKAMCTQKNATTRTESGVLQGWIGPQLLVELLLCVPSAGVKSAMTRRIVSARWLMPLSLPIWGNWRSRPL